MSTQAEPGQRGDRVVRRYERYAMQPVQLLRNPRISSHATRVFGLLDSYSDWDTQTAYPAHARLAEDMGVSVPTVRRAIKELVDAGYVSVQPAYDARGMRSGTIYTLFDAAQPSSGPGDGGVESGVITGDHTEQSQVSTPPPTGDEAPTHGCDPINTDSGQGAVPSDKSEPNGPTSSGSPGKGVDEPDVARGARTRARVNTARAKAAPNPDVKPMLLRHAQSYEAKVGAPYPIAWGKDGAIVKRLLATYGRDGLVLLQDTYFAQKADSQAALRGYTVQWLEHDAPALMARIKMHESLTDEQRQIVAALCAEGVAESTATAIAGERPIADILRQLRAHEARKDRLRNPAAALVKAIREGWEVQDEPAPAYYQPLKPAAASEGGQAGPPPEEVRLLMERTIAQLTGR